MLSRWTSKKDPSAGGPSLGDKGQQLAQEKAGHDGLTPSERTALEGMERFYGMENVSFLSLSSSCTGTGPCVAARSEDGG